MPPVFHLCLLLAVSLASPWAASQQDAYPNKPIRIIVPLGGGSGLDSSARKFGQLLAEEAKQPVIVENRPGADSAIGIREMLNAPADGYTLVALTGGMLYMSPFLIKDLAYEPQEIQSLVGLAVNDGVLITSATGKFTSLQQFLAEARKKKGGAFFGSYSQTFRGARIMLEKHSGVQFTEVPYKGAGQLITDLIGGAFDVAFMDTASAQPLIKSGKIRAIATTGTKRNKALPDTPTIAESGYPDFSVLVWSGIGISKKTPRAIVEKLEALAVAATKRPEMAVYLADRQSNPIDMNGSQLEKFVAKETVTYKELLK